MDDAISMPQNKFQIILYWA